MTLRTASAATLFTTVLFTAALLTATQAHAQISMLAAGVWTEVPPARLRPILQDMKLEASEKALEKSTVFYFQLAGYRVSLDSRAGFMELQLALSDKVTPAAMNEWNRTHRFTRAYMDTDGGATLESDLDFGGGVGGATIESFIRGFGDVIPGFANAVLQARAAGGGESAGAAPVAIAPAPAASSGYGMLEVLEGRMSVRYDSSKWKPAPSAEAGRFEFSYIPSEGLAVVIAEATAMPADKVAETAFANIRKQDSGARLTVKQKRRVAGVDVWFQTIQATIKGTPLTYYGYYYGGPAGAIQVLTSTTRSLTGGSEKDFLEFLNGLRVAY